MANLVNIWGEENADLIGDDSSPTLTIKNTSSGVGLSIDTTEGTGAAVDLLSDNTTYAGRIRSAVTEAPALLVEHSVLGSATVAPLSAVQSTASGAVLSIGGVFISTASMSVDANTTVFHIPVYHSTENILGYVAVSPGVS